MRLNLWTYSKKDFRKKGFFCLSKKTPSKKKTPVAVKSEATRCWLRSSLMLFIAIKHWMGCNQNWFWSIFTFYLKETKISAVDGCFSPTDFCENVMPFFLEGSGMTNKVSSTDLTTSSIKSRGGSTDLPFFGSSKILLLSRFSRTPFKNLKMDPPTPPFQENQNWMYWRGFFDKSEHFQRNPNSPFWMGAVFIK